MINLDTRSYLSKWLANQLSEIIENSFTRQVFIMVSSFLLGIVYMSLIIYSILESGDAYKSIISQYENAQVFILLSFVGLGLLSAYLFYFTFHGPLLTKPLKETPRLQAVRTNAKRFLVNHFFDGFNAGVKNRNDFYTHLLTYERVSNEK